MELNSAMLGLGPQAPDAAGSDLREAAVAFEGAFLQILLKSMRDTIPEGGLFNRQQMEAFEEMQDRELADSLASRGALGIADAVVRHLGGAEPPAPRSAQPIGALSHRGSVATRETAPVEAAGSPADLRSDFVNSLWPAARRAAEKLRVSAQVIVAQAALETGWGQHVPKAADGRSSHNLFGIKSGRGWSGQEVLNRTTEVLGGQVRKVVAGFRAYASVEESMADYARLIGESPRYSKALEAGDDRSYLDAIQSAGYATDPAYAKKISAILDDPGFQQQARRADAATGAP